MDAEVTWLGHATVRIEVAGSCFLTDPVLRDRLLHLRRHARSPDPAAAEGLDAILVSHRHHDHLDRASLRRIDPAVPVLGPPGTRRVLRSGLRAGGREVIEMLPGESRTVGGCRVRAVEAEHDGRRTPLGRGKVALGFVIEPAGSPPGGPDSIWFAGDTDLHPVMEELAPVALALVPVWGWGRTIGSGSHLDPERAARAVATAGARAAVPIHWGTLAPVNVRDLDWLRTPGPDFAAAAERLAPGTEVHVLEPGESLRVPLA